jgi:hypothetical protein
MKDIYQVLRQKELDLARVHKEIAALRSVIPLLVEDQDNPTHAVSPTSSGDRNKWALQPNKSPSDAAAS